MGISGLVIIMIGTSLLTGVLIGLGWALVASIKGGAQYAVITGGLIGLSFGLPMASFVVCEAKPRPIILRIAWSLSPFLVLAILLEVWMFKHYAGWVLFLQASAVVLPTLWATRPLSTFGAGLLGGAGYLIAWYIIGLTNFRYAIHYTDDILVIYPSIVVLLAIQLAIARWILRRFLWGA